MFSLTVGDVYIGVQVYIDPKERLERSLPRTYFDWYLEQIQRANAPMESLVSVLANCHPTVDMNIQVRAQAQRNPLKKNLDRELAK